MSDIDKYTKRGIALLEGNGISRDYEQAYYWLNAACELGSAEAAERLRGMREGSLGVPFDGKATEESGGGFEGAGANTDLQESRNGEPIDVAQCSVNPDRCIACGAEALEPSSDFAGAKHCSPDKGGCGTNEIIPIVEEGLDRGFALQPYSESIPGRSGISRSSLGTLIHNIKYGAFADDVLMAEMVSEIASRIVQCGIVEQLTGCAPGHEFTIVPAPSSKHRKIQPVELLAKFLAEVGYDYENVLTKRTSIESKSRPRGTELEPGDVRCAKNVQGASILLVDDTYGEGATLRACIRALRASGAREVYFLSVCKNIYGGMKGGVADDDDIH